MTENTMTGEHATTEMPENKPTNFLTMLAVAIGLIGGLGGLAGGVGSYFVMGYRVEQLEKRVDQEQVEHAARVSKDAANDTALALFGQKLDTVAGDVRDIKRAMRLSPRTARDDGP